MCLRSSAHGGAVVATVFPVRQQSASIRSSSATDRRNPSAVPAGPRRHGWQCGHCRYVCVGREVNGQRIEDGGWLVGSSDPTAWAVTATGYMLPTLVAVVRRTGMLHRRALGNACFGWLVVPWLYYLYRAITDIRPQVVPGRRPWRGVTWDTGWRQNVLAVLLWQRAPGWYPDPKVPRVHHPYWNPLRYFDGQRWTDSVYVTPAWLPDPDGSVWLRWWDGDDWAGEYMAPPPAVCGHPVEYKGAARYDGRESCTLCGWIGPCPHLRRISSQYPGALGPDIDCGDCGAVLARGSRYAPPPPPSR